MMEILFATGNAGKLREVKKILEPHGFDIIGLGDIDAKIDVVEDGETFFQNALIKAATLQRATGMNVLADDSGLCVDALGGRPGVHSARYAGEDATDAKNVEKLLEELKGTEPAERTASFICSMVFVSSESEEFHAQGVLHGRIVAKPRGEEGFGYDPVFTPDGDERTLSEFSLEEKNSISHRKRALEALLPELLTLSN